MTIPELFETALVEGFSSPALEWNGEVYTFGDLDVGAARMANLLASWGLKKGDRLAVYLSNCVEYIDLYLAATRLGVIFVPINVLYRDREIRHILEDAEPKAIITTAVQTEFITGSAVPIWLLEDLRDEVGSHRRTERFDVTDPDTPAAIVYTSGTTGASKGAVLTHRNFVVNAANLLACWEITGDDKLLLTLPLFHVHGLGNGLHCWLASGCLMRLEKRFAHNQAAQWMREFEPTVFFGVPTMYVRMLEWPSETASAIGAKMRLFVSGSAPLPAQTLEDFRSKFGHTILERYGMSETLMNLSNPYNGERRPGSVGLPLPGVSVRNLDPDGNPVADGETGELYLRGPNLFAGYWRREAATADAHRDGWFRTGDIAVRSADGYYTLQGRRSDLIISGGFNIYPREIEEFLSEQPGVVEAAVASSPDPRRGEVPVAYIVADDTFDAKTLETACRAHLASFKIPRAFVRIDKLPRTALGKIQKHLLPK